MDYFVYPALWGDTRDDSSVLYIDIIYGVAETENTDYFEFWDFFDEFNALGVLEVDLVEEHHGGLAEDEEGSEAVSDDQVVLGLDGGGKGGFGVVYIFETTFAVYDVDVTFFCVHVEHRGVVFSDKDQAVWEIIQSDRVKKVLVVNIPHLDIK